MRDDEFDQWLRFTYVSETTGQPLGSGAMSDARSRCGRVEKAMGIDLDVELPRGANADTLIDKVRSSARRFRFKNNTAGDMASIVAAVKLYARFRGARVS